MKASLSSLLFFLSVIVNGLHPLQQLQKIIQQPLSRNETSLVEVQKLDYTTLIHQFITPIDSSLDALDKAAEKTAAVKAKEDARALLAVDIAKRLKRNKAKIPKLQVGTEVPLYVTKEASSLQSIYIQIADKSWYRLRLQHKSGPTIDGPHFVQNYCDPSKKEGLQWLWKTLKDEIEAGDSFTVKDINDFLTPLNTLMHTRVKQGVDCEGGNHLEVFVNEDPQDTSTTKGSPHISGGLLYAITKTGSVYSYNSIDLDIPKAVDLIHDLLWDLSVITEKNSALTASKIESAGKKIIKYYSRTTEAPFPYTRQFADDKSAI